MTAPDADHELGTLLRLVGGTGAPGGTRVLAAVPRAPAGAGPWQLAEQTARRLTAGTAARLRAAAGFRRPRVLRPTRGALRASVRDQVRRSAGSGYVAWLPAPDRGDLLGEILRGSGSAPGGRPGIGADGAVRLVVDHARGPGLLRMGLVGSPADPERAVQALRAVPREGLPVPEVLGEGEISGVRWVVEQLLPGARPRSLSPEVVEQVAAFVAALPPGEGPLPLREDAEVVAAAAPAVAAAVRDVGAEVAGSPLAVRARLRHGDLWEGNLLVRDGALTGVVDWDAWRPADLPAVDLLHLVGTRARIERRAALGEVWLSSPWDDDGFVALLRRHWPEWAEDPAARLAIGRAWWLGQLAADLRRNPALAGDPGWVTRNITAVASAGRA